MGCKAEVVMTEEEVVIVKYIAMTMYFPFTIVSTSWRPWRCLKNRTLETLYSHV